MISEAELQRQLTIKTYEVHSRHVVNWLYKGFPMGAPCPCDWCHKKKEK